MTRSSPRRRLRSLLRALVAAVLLLAGVVGLPWLLVVGAGTPVPSHVPRWDEVFAALSRRDDGTLLLATLKYLTWICWATWVLLILVELVARARGRAARRIPGLAGPQRLAALLVTSLGAAVIGTSMSMARSAALPVTPPSLVASTAQPHSIEPAQDAGSSHGSPPATRSAVQNDQADVSASRTAGRDTQDLPASSLQRPSPDRPTITVQFGFDSTELTDNARATIADAARAIRARADPDQPMIITGHTDSLGPAAYNERLSLRRADVVREALQSHLGDVHRWETHGKGETQPAAVEGPPGASQNPAARARNRRVEITYTPKRSAPTVTPSAGPSQHPGGSDGSPPTASPTPSHTAGPSWSAPQQPRVTTHSASPSVTAETDRTQPQPPQDAPSKPPITVELPSSAVVGLSFAAGVGTALIASRLHRRRRHRTPRSGPTRARKEPHPPPAVRKLRRADLAARQSGRVDPDQAPVTQERLHLFPLPSSGQITLGVRGDEELTVPIGGLILPMTGPGAAAVARALLLSLLMHAGDHDIEVVIPRADAAQLLVCSPSSIEALAAHVLALRVTDHLEAALRLLEAERVHRARLLEENSADDLAAVRGAEPHEPLPRLVLVATTEPEQQRRLDVLCESARTFEFAVILLGESPEGRRPLNIDGAGHVTATDGHDAEGWHGLQLFHLAEEDTRQVLDVIRSAHGAAQPEPPTSTAGPRDEEHATQAPPPEPPVSDEGEARPVHLQVFGHPKVEVEGQPLETGIRGKGRELLTFLSLHPAGVSRDAILAALWPDVDHKHAVMRFHALLHDMRRALKRATGLADKNFIVVTADRYRIDSDLISVDLWRFQSALDQAAQTDDEQVQTELLQKAADAYEGHLAAEATYEAPYEWIEPEREVLRRQAVEALTHLARLYEDRNPERTLTVLERARSLDRYTEEVYQRIMTLQARLGRPDAVRRTYRLLETNLEDLAVDPSTETQQLLSRLLRASQHSQT
jgi:DNA-binding SARP family transcriptional activator/outer membrane protein OmpA-like peptidoglycan-associated protein